MHLNPGTAVVRHPFTSLTVTLREGFLTFAAPIIPVPHESSFSLSLTLADNKFPCSVIRLNGGAGKQLTSPKTHAPSQVLASAGTKKWKRTRREAEMVRPGCYCRRRSCCNIIRLPTILRDARNPMHDKAGTSKPLPTPWSSTPSC